MDQLSIPERDSGKFREIGAGICVALGYLSIPERDSGKFRVRAPGTLGICGFQGAVARIDPKIPFQLLGCQGG